MSDNKNEKRIMSTPTSMDGSGPGRDAPAIAAIISSLSITGPLKGLLRSLQDAKAAGCRVAIFNLIAPGSDAHIVEEACKTRGIPVSIHIRRGRDYWGLARTIGAACNRDAFDIVETHSFLPTFVGLYTKLRYKLPWICWMHGTTRENLSVRLFHLLDNLMQLFADRVVLVSERQRALIWGGGDGARVRVIHNSIDIGDPTPFDPAAPPVRVRFGLHPQSRYVVVIGRFSPEKGYDIFIKAFAEVVKANPDVYAILVGDGKGRSAIKEQARTLCIEEKVVFTGFTQTPGNIINEADCLVVPSRSEGIPNVILEALALKVPVVSTAVGGVPEIITNGMEGVLVPKENPDLLALGMVRVLSDPGFVRRITEAGFERVKLDFSPSKRIVQIVELYRDVVAWARGEHR